MLIPPFRCEEVEMGVYRGAYPTLRNHTFLRGLGLRTIVSLTPEKPIADLVGFCEATGARNIWHKVKKYNEAVHMTKRTVASILEVLVDPERHPVFIHCLDGSNVTGLVVMCLRKLQHWAVGSYQTEFKRFVRDRSIIEAERGFVSAFDGEVVVPSRIPKWLWQGVRVTRHPLIKVISRRDLQERKELKKKLLPAELKRNVSTQQGAGRESTARVYFVDPISSSDRNSVAYFDTLLCTPRNLKNCVRVDPKEGDTFASPGDDRDPSQGDFSPNTFVLDLLAQRPPLLLDALALEGLTVAA